MMSRKAAGAALALGLALATTAGCSRKEGPGTTTLTSADASIPGGQAAEPSPTDRPASDADVQTTQAIRRAIESDPSLSPIAKNITVVTRGGVVTLRGSVGDGAERALIVTYAKRQPGVKDVDSRIVVEHGRPPYPHAP